MALLGPGVRVNGGVIGSRSGPAQLLRDHRAWAKGRSWRWRTGSVQDFTTYRVRGRSASLLPGRVPKKHQRLSCQEQVDATMGTSLDKVEVVYNDNGRIVTTAGASNSSIAVPSASSPAWVTPSMLAECLLPKEKLHEMSPWRARRELFRSAGCAAVR